MHHCDLTWNNMHDDALLELHHVNLLFMKSQMRSIEYMLIVFADYYLWWQNWWTFVETKTEIDANTETYKSSPKTRRTWKNTMQRPPIGPSSFFINLVLSFLQFFRFHILSKFTSKFLDWPQECLLLITLSTSFSFQKLYNPKLKIVTTKSIRLKSQCYQIEFYVPQTIN